MTAQEMHTAAKLLLDKADTLNYPNYKSEELDFFLNLAQDRFVKHRYDGTVARNKGLEETQKRTDDLREVISSAQLTPLAAAVTNYPNGRYVSLPYPDPNATPPTVITYWFSISEQAIVYYPTCKPKKKKVESGQIRSVDPKTNSTQYYLVTSGSIDYNGTTYSASASGPDLFNGQQATFGGSTTLQDVTTYTGTGEVYEATQDKIDVKPIQHDDYNRLKNDPFNKPTFEESYKELHRLEIGEYIEVLFPDTDYVFSEFILRYVREPRRISLTLPAPSGTDCELADHTHQEIVDMAVSSMLENIESQRYQSHLNELNKLE